MQSKGKVARGSRASGLVCVHVCMYVCTYVCTYVDVTVAALVGKGHVLMSPRSRRWEGVCDKWIESLGLSLADEL